MKRTTRRDFIKQGVSTAAIVATGAPLMFPSRSAAAAENAASAGSLPKFSKIGMLIDTSGAGKAWQGGIQLFNQTNEGKLAVSFDTTDYSSLLQKESLLFFSGSDQYDVFPVNGEWTAALQKFLMPLDDFIAEDGMDLTALFGKDAALTIDGKVLGLPARNGPNVFAYRKDLYADAGLVVPTTVEEWATQVPKLTKKGDNGRVDIFGTSIAEGASAPHFSTVMLAYFYFPYGLRILSPDLKGPDETLIGDTAVSILAAIQQMAASGDAPNQLAWSYTDNITAWQQGQIASDSFYAARSQAIEDQKASKVAGKVGYTLSPGVPTANGKIANAGPHKPVYFAGPWYLTINGKTKNPRAAWELVKFLAASQEGQKQMALNNNNQPTLLSVLDSPEYRAKDPAADVALDIYRNYGWSTIAPVPQNADIELAIHQEVQQLFTGKAPKQVAQGIYDSVGKVLKS